MPKDAGAFTAPLPLELTDATPAEHDSPLPHCKAPSWEDEPTGRSADTRARAVGDEADPEVGPATTVFAVKVLSVAATVPEAVTAELGVDESNTPSPVKVTLVTVPLLPPVKLHGTTDPATMV